MSLHEYIRRPAAPFLVPMFLLPALLVAAPVRAQQVERFALIVATNDGGSARPRLRYAEKDALSVARVLRQLGGLHASRLLVLTGADPSSLARSLARLRAMLHEAAKRGVRREVIFYYSGHSDEQGLLLQGKRWPYRVLRQRLAALPAEMRIAVLDSCASGSLTTAKGGIRRPPFLVDNSNQVRGHAFLTAASANEAAQESDRLRGSFFTHNLVAGLRGAADTNRDRKVTLSEAYQYAFGATLAHTASTRLGAQHPHYDMNLSGSGDLVLTDLRQTSASLVFGRKLAGQLFVRDHRGHLVAELRKNAGKPLLLGLAPGTYRVQLAARGRQSVGTFHLGARSNRLVLLSTLRGSATDDRVAAKGRAVGARAELPRHLLTFRYAGTLSRANETTVRDPTQTAFSWRYQGTWRSPMGHGFELQYAYRLGPVFLGFAVGYQGGEQTYEEEDVEYAQVFPYRYREVSSYWEISGYATLQWQFKLSQLLGGFPLWRRVEPFAGLDLGGTVLALKQRLHDIKTDQLLPPRQMEQTLGAFRVRTRLGIAFLVAWRLRLHVFAHLGVEFSDRLAEGGDRNIATHDTAHFAGGAGGALSVGF